MTRELNTTENLPPDTEEDDDTDFHDDDGDDPWARVTPNHPDPRFAAIATAYAYVNPILLADGFTQDQADKMLSAIASEVFRAAPQPTDAQAAWDCAEQAIAAYQRGCDTVH